MLGNQDGIGALSYSSMFLSSDEIVSQVGKSFDFIDCYQEITFLDKLFC
jgi:hypothetical protein